MTDLQWPSRQRFLGKLVEQMALALMPRWKSASENFSLGPCRLSSFWPQPRSSVSTPRCCLMSPTTGIEPPSRMKTGWVPKLASIARTAALTPGVSILTRTAGAPWWLMIS